MMNLKPIVSVVDDDPATRDAMTVLLKSVALDVACYDTAEAFLDNWDAHRPGILVLDLRMPGMSGLELQASLDKRKTRIPIIFMTGHGNVSAAVRAMHNGAADFLTKPVDDEMLIQRVHKAIERDRAYREQRRQQDTVQARLDLLTPREYEVMEGVVAGHSNKAIARTLGISPKTVELHRGNMMNKMHAYSVAGLVQMRLSVWFDVEAS